MMAESVVASVTPVVGSYFAEENNNLQCRRRKWSTRRMLVSRCDANKTAQATVAQEESADDVSVSFCAGTTMYSRKEDSFLLCGSELVCFAITPPQAVAVSDPQSDMSVSAISTCAADCNSYALPCTSSLLGGTDRNWIHVSSGTWKLGRPAS